MLPRWNSTHDTNPSWRRLRALVVSPNGVVAGAVGNPVPKQVALPKDMRAGLLWLPTIGHVTAEPLPGGWLLRVDDGDVDATTPIAVQLRLDGTQPLVRVDGPSGV